MKVPICICLALLGLVGATSYEGYKVFSVRCRTVQEQEWVLKAAEDLRLQVWSQPKAVGGTTDVMVKPGMISTFSAKLQRRRVPFQIKIEDVQQLINFQASERKLNPSTKQFDHEVYHDLSEINSILDQAEADFPNLLSSYVAGTTFEGRDMRVVKLTSDSSTSRPGVWIDCGIHAREWVSPATCLWIIDHLTSQYGVDDDVTSIVDGHEFHIIVSANPDGYAYTWQPTGDRIWRKNRVPTDSVFGCKGVDCNRNFDSLFGGPGTSGDPCSEIYRGDSAFSELETQAIRDAVLNMKSVKAFISIHSYSQLWMTPYGYTSDLPADYNEMYRVTEIGVKALAAVHGTEYAYGNIADTIYPASGGSIDWAYDSVRIVYSYALELRDTGRYGFLLPPEYIVPTAEETWTGLAAALEAMQ